MKYQKGLSLPIVILVAIVAALILLVSMKILPAYTEAGTIRRAVHKLANEHGSKPSELIRGQWSLITAVDPVNSISAKDLIITREGTRAVIAYKYDYIVPLVSNINLSIHFEGSSKDAAD